MGVTEPERMRSDVDAEARRAKPPENPIGYVFIDGWRWYVTEARIDGGNVYFVIEAPGPVPLRPQANATARLYGIDGKLVYEWTLFGQSWPEVGEGDSLQSWVRLGTRLLEGKKK